MTALATTLLALSHAAPYSLRGATPIKSPGSSDFVSSPAVLHAGSVSMFGVRAPQMPTSTGSQVQGILDRVDAELKTFDMKLSDIVKVEVSLANVSDWYPEVEDGLLSRLSVSKCGVAANHSCLLPAIAVWETKFVDEGVKAQMNIVAAENSETKQGRMAAGTGGIGIDEANNIVYLSAVTAPGAAATGSISDQVNAIMPVVEAQLQTVGMDKHNLVATSIAMEPPAARNATASFEELKEFNIAVNTWMSGAVLPTMTVANVAAFPGSEAEGMQIQVNVIAARDTPEPYSMLAGDSQAGHDPVQLTAPVPVDASMGLPLPYNAVADSGNTMWLSGLGYYGNSTDMTVAANDVMSQLHSTLASVDLDASAVATAEILVAEAGRKQLAKLQKVYHGVFAHGTGAPTLSIREVAEIAGDSLFELTVSAAAAAAATT